MSSGELWVFGAPLPDASALAHLPPELHGSNPQLVQREQNKCILPEPISAATQEDEPAVSSSCLAVSKLLSSTLVLLEDGQVVSLDRFSSFEPWVADAFAQLNAMHLPLVDIAIGGRRAVTADPAHPVPRSGASGPTGNFFIALSATGEVLVFGQNDRGQLGLGHTRNVLTPTRLPKFSPPTNEADAAAAAAIQSNIQLASRAPVPVRIVAVAAGRAHSLAITADGALYAWGRDMEGQCALSLATGESARTLSTRHLALHVTPRFVQHLQGRRIVRIAAANHASLALDDEGSVWHFGYGLGKEQINVPTRVQFEQQSSPQQQGSQQEEKQQSPPVVASFALGHAHALLLDTTGSAYSFGVGLTGALGHAFPEESASAHRPRLEKARRIGLPVSSSTKNKKHQQQEERVVHVFAGAYSSALLSSRGQVYTFGGGNACGAKLGLGEDGSDERSGVAVPTLVKALSHKIVSSLAMDSERLLAFVPTRLTAVSPPLVQLTGGTVLTLKGSGFFVRGDDQQHSQQNIVVQFSYRGVQARAKAMYDPLTDVLRVTAPSLVAEQNNMNKSTKSKKGAEQQQSNGSTANGAAATGAGGGGGIFRNGHLENCLLRVSLDNGLHFSNALSVHVFSIPDMSSHTIKQKDGSRITVTGATISPDHGPIQGGTKLTLKTKFDILPYQQVQVRFRLPQNQNGARGGEGEGIVIATVPGEFDPVSNSIRCVAPILPVSLLPPSVALAAATSPLSPSKPSRFVRPAVQAPRSTLVSATLDVSLDGGQNFFPFAAATPFRYYNTTASSVSPSTIGVAGADIELSVRGVHFTTPGSELSLRFSVHGGFKYMDVPARFVPLQQHREQKREERERRARQGRKARAEAILAAKLRAEQLAIEEEENRDPKEKERIAKEKAAAEREKAKAQLAAEKAAAAAAAAEARAALAAANGSGSRPGSGQGSRPMSSSGAGKRPSSRERQQQQQQQARDASPHAVRPFTADKLSVAAALAAADMEATASAAEAQEQQQQSEPQQDVTAAADEQQPVQDEWSEEEARITAAEAAEDKQLALLSPADRAAVGYVCARAPLFTDFGACTPSLSLSQNGVDFVSFTPPQTLQVSRPLGCELSPAWGPSTGGTTVEVRGQHFYLAHEIAVQVRPAAAAAAAGVGAPNAAAGTTSSTATTAPAARPTTAAGSAAAVAGGLISPSAADGSAARGLPRGSIIGSAGRVKPGSLAAAAAAAAVEASEAAAAAAAAFAASHPVSPRTVASEFVVHPAPEEPSLRFVTPSWPSPTAAPAAPGTTNAVSVHVGFDPSSNAFSSPGLPFLFYEPPVVLEAHPLLVSQAGGTEVVLSGRGFLALPGGKDSIKVRLVLPPLSEEEARKVAATAAAGAAASAGAAAGGRPPTSSQQDGNNGSDSAPPNATGRRRSMARMSPSTPGSGGGNVDLSSAFSSTNPSAAAAAAAAAAPSLPTIVSTPIVVEVAAVRDAHDSPEETEEYLKQLAKNAKKAPKTTSSSSSNSTPTAAAGGAAAAAGKSGVDPSDGVAEQATISFTVPSAISFSSSFSDGASATNRPLEVELSLNGQQFHPTGITLRFDKDGKLPPKKTNKIDTNKKK